MTAIVQKAGKKFLVPKGWSLVTIGDLFKVTRGKVLPMGLVSAESTRTDPYPVYSSQTKKKGLAGFYSEYLYEDAITWTTDGANAGDVNFRAGKFYCTNVCGVLLNTHGHANTCVASILNSVTRGYVSYVGNPKLMNDVMATINIPLPPLAEQRKIAEILRTWDGAIETAEAELKVKQDRKRWLLHKLLTCPSELNGALCQNAWTTVGLGEVASFQNGEAFSSRYFNSEKRGLRLIRNRDLKNDDQIIFYDGEYSDKDVVNDGDLLVGMDGDFTPVIWSKGKALLNQRVGRITVKPEISQSYIYYTLYSVLTELEHVTSATTVKHLSSKGCLLLKISMPPFTSQCFISGILQSADADINAINQRIDSLRTQKRGLMQKLLTGEVRVAA